jgi:hydrogenase maturation protein HypF
LEMQAVAWPHHVTGYPFAIHQGKPGTLDVLPMINAIVEDCYRGVPTALIARRFHSTVTDMLATLCVLTREQTGLNAVALSGGVFQNRLLLEQLVACLEACSFAVYINRRVPPNDGGLSLGQAAVAAAQLRANIEHTTEE